MQPINTNSVVNNLSWQPHNKPAATYQALGCPVTKTVLSLSIFTSSLYLQLQGPAQLYTTKR